MSETSRTDSGFTTLEVIIAFLIVTLALSAIYEAVAGAYRSLAAARLRQETLLLAQSHLDAVGAGGTITLGLSDGLFANGVRWRQEVSLVADRTRLPSDRVRPCWVELGAVDANRRPIFELKTIKLGAVAL